MNDKPILTEMNDEPKLTDVIDWGQGNDDECVDLIKTFGKFADAYYHLAAYSDEWWEFFNQSDIFNKAVKRQWDKLESIDFMSIVEEISMLITGAYTKFSEFSCRVEQAYKLRKER